MLIVWNIKFFGINFVTFLREEKYLGTPPFCQFFKFIKTLWDFDEV
jgi:hypothetical protein